MKVLSLRQVQELIPVSPSTIWRWERSGRFPMRLHLGAGSVAWVEQEVHDWLANRPRGIAQRG